MRILQVIPNIESFHHFLVKLSEELLHRGWEVHLASSQRKLWKSDRQPLSLPIQFHDIPFARGMNPVSHFSSARQLNRLVSEIRPDIVHAHFSAGIFVTGLAKRRSWPVTLGTFQGVSFLLNQGVKGRLAKWAEVWSANRLDEAWVLTEDDRQGLSEAAPKARVKVQSSPGFGCDLDRFQPDQVTFDERQALRTELGIQSGDTVFSFIGRHVNFKGFDETVRAFLRLARGRNDVKLLLVGTRDSLHPTGLTKDEEQALRTCPQIQDLGWRVDVSKYLAVSDVTVFPSKREGMPVCLMEALAMGVPVITRDSRGCRDVVRNGVDGIVLSDCSSERLTEAMAMMASDPDTRARYSRAALAGRHRFDRQHFIREQLDIYDEWCSQSPHRVTSSETCDPCRLVRQVKEVG